MTTNLLNNSCWNDFTVRNGPSGGVRKIRVQNENNIAGSEAIVESYVQGTTSADPYTRSVIGASHSYATGIDTSDNQAWKLTYDASATASPSSALQVIKSDTSGRLIYPNQPMMKAHKNADTANVTGENTEYTVIFDTVEYDRDGNYNNANGIFTVPIDGCYQINTLISFYNIQSGYIYATGCLRKNGSNICMQRENPVNVFWANSGANIHFFHMTITESAVAGDTFSSVFSVANNVSGGKIVGVKGTAQYTYTCIRLVG